MLDHYWLHLILICHANIILYPYLTYNHHSHKKWKVSFYFFWLCNQWWIGTKRLIPCSLMKFFKLLSSVEQCFYKRTEKENLMQETLILFKKIWKPYANPKRKKMFHIENTFVENELLYLRQILVWLREP